LSANDAEAVVANFRLGLGVTKNTRSGQAKATIAVSNMPKLYQTLSDWIYAAHKNAPEAVEKQLSVTNNAGASVPMVWFVPPDGTGYIFLVGKSPVHTLRMSSKLRTQPVIVSQRTSTVIFHKLTFRGQGHRFVSSRAALARIRSLSLACAKNLAGSTRAWPTPFLNSRCGAKMRPDRRGQTVAAYA